MPKNRLIALCLFLLAPVCLFAQTTRVRGKVSDALSGKGVPFATVFFDGTMTAAYTDSTGTYSLEMEGKDARYQLTAIVAGYQPQTRTVSGGTDGEVNFLLAPEARASGEKEDVRLRSILYNLQASRARHDPESRDAWPRYMVSRFRRTSSRAVAGMAGALSPSSTPESCRRARSCMEAWPEV